MKDYKYFDDERLIADERRYCVGVEWELNALNPREDCLEAETGISFYIPYMPRGYKEVNDFEDERSSIYKDYCEKDYCENEEDIFEFLEDEERKGKTVLSVYCCHHGGVALGFGDFGDRWDSWKAGVAVLDEGVSIEQAKDELQKFEDYLNGYVYKMLLYDKETDVIFDCFHDLYAEEGMTFTNKDIIKTLSYYGYITTDLENEMLSEINEKEKESKEQEMGE